MTNPIDPSMVASLRQEVVELEAERAALRAMKREYS